MTDINKLVGDNSKIQIPQVVVKWITYALVLHIVALVLAAGSTLFGILAHIREFLLTDDPPSHSNPLTRWASKCIQGLPACLRTRSSGEPVLYHLISGDGG